jgi:hypothetical protein
MLNEYAEFKSISIDELNTRISNSGSLLLNDIKKYREVGENKMDYLFYNSLNLPLEIIKLPFSIDLNSMINKYSLFSPYLLQLLNSSEYNKVLEFMGGTSLFSEFVSGMGKEVTYASPESEMFNFVKWRVSNRNLNIKIKEVARDFKLYETYDFIMSDGVLQLFNDEEQYNILESMTNSLNKGGVLALLVDWSGSEENPLNYDIDVSKLHDYLDRKDLVCIYGKNTFSSLWKKMF